MAKCKHCLTTKSTLPPCTHDLILDTSRIWVNYVNTLELWSSHLLPSPPNGNSLNNCKQRNEQRNHSSRVQCLGTRRLPACDLCCNSLDKDQEVPKREGDCKCTVHHYSTGAKNGNSKSLRAICPLIYQWCSLLTTYACCHPATSFFFLYQTLACIT